MRHRDPRKYKEFQGQENVIVGYGELVAVKTSLGIGWITPCNHIFYNRTDAEVYASKLNELIVFNRRRVLKQRNRFK